MKSRKAINLTQVEPNSKRVEEFRGAIKEGGGKSEGEPTWTRSFLATYIEPKELQVRK